MQASPPPQVTQCSDVTTDRLIQKLFPDQIQPKAPPVVLPLAAAVKSCLSEYDKHNESSFSTTWTLPSTATKACEFSKAYRPPAPDPETGLDLAKIAQLDADCAAAKIVKPTPSAPVSLPVSLLESWELRARKSMGIASQLDILVAYLMQMATDSEHGCSPEMRSLLFYIGRSTKNIASNASANLAEMLRLRRSKVLESSPQGFLMQRARDRLLTAPLSSPTLFGGRIKEVLAADKDEQLHAAMARASSAQSTKAGGFKRPAPPARSQGP